MQVPACFAWQTQRDRLELKEQIVSERARKCQLVVGGIAKFLRQCPQNRKHGWLLTAFFFREDCRHGFENAFDRAVLFLETFPMRMIAQHRRQHAVDRNAAVIQRTKRNLALKTDQFQRWTHGNHVPARIPPRVLVAGRKINTPAAIQIAAEAVKPLREREFGSDT